MTNFETIIGIEIHIELNTKTKMFSHAPNLFDAFPNTNVSVIDLAYPGTMPSINKGAVVKGIQLAKALNMKIDRELHFDRKNYFYPDLPKGFQITQNERPIGSEGEIPIFIDGNWKKIAIERIHLEEDTAKSIHQGEFTLLDYNRAGVPLIEIVTHPVIRNAKEACLYIDSIRQVAKALNISDAKMEEGSLRADINISLRPYGQEAFGTKVEIKNLNSLANVEKAIEKEIELQTKKILKGEEILQATKRFDESKQETVIMRVKNDAADYRYFPEPNIPIIKLEEDFIESIKISELPWTTFDRLKNANVDLTFINQMIQDRDKLAFFDQIDFADKGKVAKLFFSEIVSLANEKNTSVLNLNMDFAEISLLIKKQESGEISGAHVKKIMPLLINKEKTVNQLIDELGFKQISNKDILEPMIGKIIKDNMTFIEENKERKERVTKFVLGLVMKESKGQANPVIASEIVDKMLNLE